MAPSPNRYLAGFMVLLSAAMTPGAVFADYLSGPGWVARRSSAHV